MVVHTCPLHAVIVWQRKPGIGIKHSDSEGEDTYLPLAVAAFVGGRPQTPTPCTLLVADVQLHGGSSGFGALGFCSVPRLGGSGTGYREWHRDWGTVFGG